MDTIAAIATAPGRGGVGIVRVSGPGCQQIAHRILGLLPPPREAKYTPFFDRNKNLLDQGIALYFSAPNSFTGEDVLEFQGHGGPVILDMLLAEILAAGARLARPGEFSERAFLNDKLDLAQAEAIADLIDASSQQAAKQAINSLQGAFSEQINHLVEELIHLRMYVESAIDFPEEEIDFLSDGKVAAQLDNVLERASDILHTAQQGVLMREGMKVVIAGRPNAGKSSLLNALAQRDIAIVTDIEGTTRDVLREQIHIDGMPLHIVDTAGLRAATDKVEQIGIERAWQEIDQADRILLMVDSTRLPDLSREDYWQQLSKHQPTLEKVTVIYNKIDDSGFTLPDTPAVYKEIALSAKTGAGIDALIAHLKSVMGYQQTGEGGFSARRRHLDAIQHALTYLNNGRNQLQLHAAGELLAEDLRLAQDHLSEITGKFTSDDLLGKIFSSFCIGK
ncbi:tRNA modification GTPase TrmE [Teredinibacter turnerae T7901]|uniref:tRNA modification GTPase MnmE n=1 Tax=Teredinibacter turnerae (strain ATCC 39867 / T7901) TaxID=377629 RepID=C5BKL6_TERTT|nr:tRNA uridine-5-carboxymethylaminomethyl(34) synthesis GTPase MnmE [Teredinibacter turnerae]ACR13194.1 tRNA modification GTPase TrmE [Teredinibacter turnerae T7901]